MFTIVVVTGCKSWGTAIWISFSKCPLKYTLCKLNWILNLQLTYDFEIVCITLYSFWLHGLWLDVQQHSLVVIKVYTKLQQLQMQPPLFKSDVLQWCSKRSAQAFFRGITAAITALCCTDALFINNVASGSNHNKQSQNLKITATYLVEK